MPRSPHPAAAALTLALLLGACGSTGDAVTAPQERPSASEPATSDPTTDLSPDPTTDPVPDPPDVPTAGTALTITVDDGAGTTTTRTLTCGPAGGDVPVPATACAALAAAGPAAFAPPRTDLACAMQYGGPQTATVTGALGGRPVTADYARTDGCQISRWDALAPLLGAADGGGPDS